MTGPALLDRLRGLGLAGPEATARLFKGGYKNAVWLVETAQDRLVAKVYMPAAKDDNPYYPNHPADEAMALRHLAGTGLAPEFIAWFPEKKEPALLVYRFVDGPTWFADAAAAARLIAGVHAVALPDGLRRVAATPAAIVAHGAAMMALSGSAWPTLEALKPHDAADTPPGRLALIHTDCGPGNIVMAKEGPRLIDWQCPALGDPAEDIACFLSPAMMTLYRLAPHRDAAVAAFLGSYGEGEAVDRYRRHADAFHWRIAAYCAYRTATLARADPDIAALYGEALAAEMAHLKA